MKPVSLIEFYDRLAEYSLGWLGWSEEQALAADVNAIIVGIEGRWAMLEAMFGGDGREAGPPAPTTRDLSPALFDAALSRPL